MRTPPPYRIGYTIPVEKETTVQTYGRRKKIESNGGMIIARFFGPDHRENALFFLHAVEAVKMLERLSAETIFDTETQAAVDRLFANIEGLEKETGGLT